jgi:hypothetical protein
VDQLELRLLTEWPGYLAGSDGYVYSLWIKGPCGEGPRFRENPRRLTPAENDGGYLHVTLVRDGRKHTRRVSRLILTAFRGPCPEGMEACHNNGDRRDDRIDNLRWDTRESNYSDRERHGKTCRGSTSPLAKLNEAIVLEIDRLAIEGMSGAEIAVRFGVTRTLVNRILRGECWKHVPRSFDSNSDHRVARRVLR